MDTFGPETPLAERGAVEHMTRNGVEACKGLAGSDSMAQSTVRIDIRQLAPLQRPVGSIGTIGLRCLPVLSRRKIGAED